MTRCLAAIAIALLAGICSAEEASNKPKEIPATRILLKQALERAKTQQARVPLPPATAEERQPPEKSSVDLSGESLNSARLRNLYLPRDLLGARSPKDSRQRGRTHDPSLTLDKAFCLQLVWIASRANNCHYCLGHQEVKLRSVGSEDAVIAALDCDWSRFSPAEQAAFALSRKLTLRPDQLVDDDFQAVLEHYKPLQVLEMVMLIARYNMSNRWNSSLGIPQEEYRKLLTETAPEFAESKSTVAIQRIEERQPLETRAETLATLARVRHRRPRFPLVSEVVAREIVSLDKSMDVPLWIRALANFPIEGKSHIELYQLSVEKGGLPPELKAEIAWVASREDRAWYAIDQAAKRLRSLSYTEDRIFELDAVALTSTDRFEVARAFARKLTATPQAIADADIANLRKYFTDSEVVEIVYHVTRAAFFNRVTESASLPVDSG